MKGSTKFLLFVLCGGVGYTLLQTFSANGGSLIYAFADSIILSSIILFVAATGTLLWNVRKLRTQLPTVLFMILGLPLTTYFVIDKMEEHEGNRMPDLHPKYSFPVTREQYLLDSLDVQRYLDSTGLANNIQHGGPDNIYSAIDTIIYSQKGNMIFVSVVRRWEGSGIVLSTDCVSSDEREGSTWKLQSCAGGFFGSYPDRSSLKTEVRKYYFNNYSLLDADSAAENYFWGFVLYSH